MDAHDNNVCKRPSENPSVHISLLFSEKCIFYNSPTGELLGTVFLLSTTQTLANVCALIWQDYFRGKVHGFRGNLDFLEGGHPNRRLANVRDPGVRVLLAGEWTGDL